MPLGNGTVGEVIPFSILYKEFIYNSSLRRQICICMDTTSLQLKLHIRSVHVKYVDPGLLGVSSFLENECK
jgi:hypothetical protein